MKYLKLFEDYKVKGITINDIIQCIENDGVIYCDIIHDYPNHDKDDKLKPISVDNNTVSVIIDGINYDINIEDITKIEF